MPVSRIISAEDRHAIAKLQLFARGVVEGINAGRHRSPLKGSSIEFKEHRQYARGDEIRSIDWKLFGKTDRLFIRQYEDETSLRAMILLDQSGSMAYRGSRAAETSKHDFAVKLAASIATLLVAQQDAVGIATIDTQLRDSLPIKSTPSHLQSIFYTLVQSKPGKETSLGNALQQAAGKLRRRGLLILISDCFDDVEHLLSALRYFRHGGHEVIVFQVWAPDELDFPFQNRTQFCSLENTKQHIVDPTALRTAYLKRVQEFRQQLATATARERIELVTCTTADSHSDVLVQFLDRRRGTAGRNNNGSQASSSSMKPSEEKR